MSKSESDPYGKKQHEPGAKLDAGKPSIYRGLLDYFPRACIAVSGVSDHGASKYAWKGWESVPNGVVRYADACARHIVKEAIEGPIDSDSGLLHKAHKAWNALAELELYIREQENAKKRIVPESSRNYPLDSGSTADMAYSNSLCGISAGQRGFGMDGNK